MTLDQLILVSVGDHVVEPAHLFEGRVSAIRSTRGTACRPRGRRVPYFMERLDHTDDMHRVWTGQDFGDRVPSEVFREHFLPCFIADPVGLALRHLTGIDSIAWECDCPHSDSTWPTPAETLMAVADGVADSVPDGVPDVDLEKIDHQNACRGYSFDPFAHLPKAQATVGVSRRFAQGHDVTTRPFDKGRFVRRGKGIEVGDIAARATA